MMSLEDPLSTSYLETILQTKKQTNKQTNNKQNKTNKKQQTTQTKTKKQTATAVLVEIKRYVITNMIQFLTMNFLN